MTNMWDEYESTPEEIQGLTYDGYVQTTEDHKSKLKRQRRNNILNTVRTVPPLPQELLDLRDKYANDYVLAHKEMFKNSTGICDLSEKQIESVRFSERWVKNGGRALKVEPRGYGKTSRGCNEGINGVLSGHIDYLLVLGSTSEKALEILESILIEIRENEVIYKLFPRVVECFRHYEENPRRGDFQIYDGNRTYISVMKGLIKFPIIEGEPSSGAIINVRPKKNVRGIYFTESRGPNAGRRRRPSHILGDDLQTDEEAESPAATDKQIRLLKKGVFRSGAHQKKTGIMLTATPIAPHDLVHHLIYKENWPRIVYPMLISRATHEDMWLVNYANILNSYDAEIPGDETRAELEALEYFKQNKEKMLEGAEASWEHAYNMWDDPQTEIHAVQHAYNILIREGEEVFECECQCNVRRYQLDPSITLCSKAEIVQSVNKLPRFQLEPDVNYISTHIDINLPFFTHTTVASPQKFRGQVVDYATFPDQGIMFKKSSSIVTIARSLSNVPNLKDRIYLALKAYLDLIYKQEFKRTDGVVLRNKIILVDSRWEGAAVRRAIRDSDAQTITYPSMGYGLIAKDKPFPARSYGDSVRVFKNCIIQPASDNTMNQIDYDNNYFKTFTHEAFKQTTGVDGSMSLFLPPENSGFEYHKQWATHVADSEEPRIDEDKKTNKRKTVWENPSDADNEYLDNVVAALAGLEVLGVRFEQTKKGGTEINIAEFMRKQYT